MSSIDDYRNRMQAPDFDRIPARLRAGRHHVAWNPAQRGQKVQKTPYIARAFLDTGRLYPASSIKRRSWSTFPQARAAYEREPRQFAGIGRVLNNDITLVDIDHCIITVVTEDSVIEEIHPAALEIMALLDTYAERSPGADGLHIFPAGAIPDNARNRYQYKGLEIEIYSTGRYSTLTGHHIASTPEDVQDRQANITALIEHLTRWEEENTVCVCVCDAGSQEQPAVPPNEQSQEQARQLAQHDDQARASTGRAPLAGNLPNTNRNENVLRFVGAIAERDLPLADQAVLAKARAARNGQNFMQLWEGGDPQQRGDKSKADFDLVLQLLYWTYDDQAQTERLYRASRRYDEKTDRKATRTGRSYLQHTIDSAIQKRHKARRAPTASHTPEQPEPEPPTPGPGAGQRRPARQDRRITHAHHWTRAQETPEQRQEKLQAAARAAAERIEQHVRSGQAGLLVANIAPGVGKSNTVAPLGKPGTGLDLAWIAERRDMVSSVEALGYYHQIEPCTRHNCTDHQLHNALGERGYNAWAVHKRHGLQCHYAQQFTRQGSAVYQLAHVKTRYPANHSGIIIDELDVTKWLPEREINTARLSAAARIYATDSTADLLLRAIAATITDASQARQQPHGLELFTALDRRAGGQLANWLAELAQDPRYTNTHPWYEIEEDDPDAQALEAATLAPVVLPHIVVALISELVKWQQSQQSGKSWNSCIRIGPGAHGHALYITERLRFAPGEQGLPARAILDATADAEILSRLFSEQIELQQAEIEPPPGTRHLAIRTGKRYGKTALCSVRKDGSRPDLVRAAAEARYILRELDPDGSAQAAHSIGLISFKGCIDQLGELLGIPESRRLHFWAARGSNALQDCTILLVIGTPTVAPAAVARLARALYQDDPEPISTESTQDGQGIRRYLDPRMQRVNDYLTRSELTQCAHRSRALRATRQVVTFCLGEIDYLPATETITDLPALTPEGRELWQVRREREHQALEQARQEIEQSGKSIHMLSVREIKAAAHVSTDAAADYLRQARHIAQHTNSVTDRKPPLARELPNNTSAHEDHTHTHTQCSHSVPDIPSNIIIENVGTNETENAPRPPDMCQVETETRPGTETTPPQCNKPCARCGHVDDWQQEPDTKRWLCSCYWWWYEHPERCGPQQLMLATG